MRLRVAVTAHHIDVAGHDVERRRVVQVRLEHRVQEARGGAVESAAGAVPQLVVLEGRVEGLLIDIRDVVPEVDVGLQTVQEGQAVVGLHVADAAVGSAVALGQGEDLRRVVRGLQGDPPVVVAGGGGLVVHRLSRPHLGGVAEHAGGQKFVERARAFQVGANAHAVIEQTLLVVEPERDPLGRAASDDAVLIEIADRQAVVVVLAGARDDHVVLMAEPRAVHDTEPVGARVRQLTEVGRRVLGHGRAELRRVQHLGKSGDRRGGHAGAVLDPRRSLLPGFCLDDHHTARGVHSVDRRRRSILEHRDALDVIGVQEVESIAPGGQTGAGVEHIDRVRVRQSHRHAVDHVERIARGRDRIRTANPQRHAAARLVVVDQLHACDLALDELLRADDSARVELRRGHLGYGAGDIARPLRPIAGDHDFRQAHRLGGQGEIGDERLILRDRDRLGGTPVADQSRP